ncbi:MAG: hypothetical protein EP332_13345 [Bacteroidetes bacterium]|nr:MAG: hypothetical protein EP332_13345 [Bacteroidota bacterium]
MGSEGTQSSAINTLKNNRELSKYESVFKRKNISTRDWLKLGTEIPQETKYAFPEMEEQEWAEFRLYLEKKQRKENRQLTWLFIGISAVITAISIILLNSKVSSKPDPNSFREKLKKEKVEGLVEVARKYKYAGNTKEAMKYYQQIYAIDSTEPNARKALGLTPLH